MAALALPALAAPLAAEEGAVRGVPVEFFACNFVDGQGMSDLMEVVEEFNEWSDQYDSAYAAWVITPQYHNNPDMFDVGWLGAWPNGESFGTGMDAWRASGGDIAESFTEVIDCSGRHEMATSFPIHTPDGQPGDGIVLFSECRLHDGKNGADALTAHGKAAAATAALGSAASHWLFFPAMGSGDIDFDYWRVAGMKNYADLGAAAEMLTNGGGMQKVAEAIGPVADCGAWTGFDARQVRRSGS